MGDGGRVKGEAGIRVRFAPSPTGHLHIGSARTALFNWLYARSFNGVYVLRIEDTDRDRSTETFEHSIVEDLAWLGLAWDEGPDIGGPHGPYRQTERMAAGMYERRAQTLLESGRAYHCFCSAEELEAERAAALAKSEMPKYSGKCRALSDTQRQALIDEGRAPTIRFAVPPGERIAFDDIIRGGLEFQTGVIGDFIILRQDGSPTYNFAVVVDDLDMEITHVLRGEDHITNTARQMLLFEALGAEPPVFGHFSMILGPDKAKLSKRHGAAAVGDYRREGYISEAIINYLALLSWSSPTGAEVLRLDELIREFSADRVSKSPAIFDAAKLKWLNGQHIRRLDPVALTNLVLPYLVDKGLVEPEEIASGFERLARVVEGVQTNLEVLPDIVGCVKIFGAVIYDDETAARLREPSARKVMAAFSAALERVDDIDKDGAKALITSVSEGLKAEGVKGKEIFQTMRLALTGALSGPELFYLLYGLGPDETRRRLDKVLK